MSVFDDLYQLVLKGKQVDIIEAPAEVFFDPLILGQILKQSRENLIPSDAFDVLLKLEPFLVNKNWVEKETLTARGYQRIVDYLRFIALSFQPDSMIEKIFLGKLFFALQEGIDVQSIVDVHLMTIGDNIDDSSTRQAMLRGMRANEEHFGRVIENINVGTNQHLSSILKNWLLDYELMQGGKKDRGAFEQSEYIAKSKNIKYLDEEEKKLLRRILRLYDYLLFKPAVLPSVDFLSRQKNITSIKLDEEILPQENIVDELLNSSVSADKVIKSQVKTVDTSLPTHPLVSTKVMAVIPQAPLALMSASPAFLFDEQDEREIDSFRIMSNELEINSNLGKKLKALADRVIIKHKLNFTDEAHRRKFVNIFVSYIKGVRGIVEIREALSKADDKGGLGIMADKIESILQIFTQTKKDFESGVVEPALKKIDELDALIRADVASVAGNMLQKKSLPQVQVKEELKISPPHEVSKNEELKIKNHELLANNNQGSNIAPTIPTVPITPPIAAKTPDYVLKDITSRTLVSSATPAPKPELTDVRAPRRTMGPLDELRSLSLIDFRRLGATVSESLAHVRQKIDFASEHSVGKRVEAIRAWQASVVHQMYVQIGSESIETGQHIAQVIAEFSNRHDPFLTEVEFNAIADFNESLRF